MAVKNKTKERLYKKRPKKLVEFPDLQKLSKKLKASHKKVVFTTGSFEFITPGHCRYLAEAKAKGDVLVVGVGTDDSLRRLRGANFPLVSEDVRAEMVSYLKSVDYVTVVDEDRPHAALILLKPDIFFTSDGAWESGVRVDQDKVIVKMYGGKIFRRKKEEPYFGSGSLVERVADIRVLQILENYLKEKIPGTDLELLSVLEPIDFGEQIPNDRKALDVKDLIIASSEVEEIVKKLRGQGRSIVFVSGTYDLLHAGHSRFIEKAGLWGGVLIVGLPSDRSVRKFKGLGRPMICERSRAYSLCHLDPVDYVTIFDEDTVLQTIQKIKPDVFYTVKEDWNKGYKQSPEYKAVIAGGGKVVLGDRESPNISASVIIDKVARGRVVEIFKDCMDEEKYQKILKEKSRLNVK